LERASSNAKAHEPLIGIVSLGAQRPQGITMIFNDKERNGRRKGAGWGAARH